MSPEQSPRPTTRSKIPFTRAVTTVAEREITTRLQAKGFLIPTLITVALILVAGVAGPKLMGLIGSDPTIAVTAETQSHLAGTDGYDLTVADSSAGAYDMVETGEVDAALVGDPDAPAGLRVVAVRDVPGSLIPDTSLSPEVELLDPNAPDPAVVGLIGLGFGLAFFMTAMMFGMVIAQSVVEEKQTRIVEILLAMIPSRAIILGKVLGNAVLAFGQIALYAIASLLALAINGEQLNLDGLGVPILWFVLFFTVSFIMLAALYGAGASLVSRQEDIGSATSLVTLLVMVPYFLIISFANNPGVLAVLSFIPFSSAVAVPMRVYLGEIALWEIGVILLINLVATTAALYLADRIYERAVLRMGKAWSWGKALRSPAGS